MLLIAAITIVVVLGICLLLWLNRKKTAAVQTVSAAQPARMASASLPAVRFTRLSESAVETEAGSGRRFRRVMIEKATPRFTYLLGTLKGKYWAEPDGKEGEEDVFVTRYQFHIYEVTFWVNDGGVSKGQPFAFEPDAYFPVHKLPPTIPCHLVFEGNTKRFGVVLHQPKFSGVRFARKLQQEEGSELFGTIEATATGYILDELREVNETIEFLPDISQVTAHVDDAYAAAGNGTAAGRAIGTVSNGGYRYRWGGTNTYRRRGYADNFLAPLFSIAGWVFVCLFLIALLPKLLFLLPLIVVVLVFRLIPAVLWEWLVRIVFGVMLLGWIGALLFAGGKRERSHTAPVAADYDSVATAPQPLPPAGDAVAENRAADTLIWHYRKWYNYSGKLYRGRYYVTTNDYQRAHTWKNEIAVSGSGQREYDYMLYLLKEHDQNKLAGVYQMFDSIKAASRLDSVQFAEMVVSCIQQIPYCLVLDKECNPSLYSDAFIRNYLRSENARCDSYERFGINTPVEFMATGKGDCDSRTLLLYVVFRHYGYKVAVLSSEYYSHSLLGIHLPLEGQAYYYKNEPYYCWETTAAGMPAGVMAKEVADMRYWRLSLTSQ